MEKLIDAIAGEFFAVYDRNHNPSIEFDREAIRLLIAEYAAEQYNDGFDDGYDQGNYPDDE